MYGMWAANWKKKLAAPLINKMDYITNWYISMEIDKQGTCRGHGRNIRLLKLDNFWTIYIFVFIPLFKTALSRYNSYTMQFAHLKCTTWWFLFYSHCVTITAIYFRTLLAPQGNLIFLATFLTSTHHQYPPALWNH